MKTTNSTDNATARPWKFEGVDSREIFSSESGRTIAKVDFQFGRQDEIGRANAALIVRAVNEYEALVAVAEAAKGFDVDRHILPDALHVALDNLAAVRGNLPS